MSAYCLLQISVLHNSQAELLATNKLLYIGSVWVSEMTDNAEDQAIMHGAGDPSPLMDSKQVNGTFTGEHGDVGILSLLVLLLLLHFHFFYLSFSVNRLLKPQTFILSTVSLFC